MENSSGEKVVATETRTLSVYLHPNNYVRCPFSFGREYTRKVAQKDEIAAKRPRIDPMT